MIGINNQFGLAGSSFVDRGDPGAADFDQGDLTTDGTWNDLDLSSIVPAGATEVLLYVRMYDDAVDKGISFRENGNSNTFNIESVNTVVANANAYGSPIVKLDINRIIEYSAANNTYTFINITVRGWWL
jgi:hypothetical protein